MRFDDRTRSILLLLKWSVILLIGRVTFGIVSNYGNYFPANMDSDFLLGRERSFRGVYQVFFYTHILSSPTTILTGLILMNDRFRQSFPAWHRLIGRCHVGVVLLLVVPSGLWMSGYAMSGYVAGAGFATLAIVTGVCATMGWRLAIKKRFEPHRRWMTRCFLLLCSAIVLRLFAGATSVARIDSTWLYPISAWVTWIVPLICFEVLCAFRKKRIATLSEP